MIRIQSLRNRQIKAAIDSVSRARILALLVTSVTYVADSSNLVFLIIPYFYGRTVNVPPPSLNFFACENELLANQHIENSKHMKTETNSAPDVPALPPSTSLTRSDSSDLSDQSDSVQPSQTKSNQIHPTPSTPGKELVNFLAIFDRQS